MVTECSVVVSSLLGSVCISHWVLMTANILRSCGKSMTGLG